MPSFQNEMMILYFIFPKMSSKKFQKEAAAEFPPPLQTHAFKLVQSGLVILDKPVSFKNSEIHHIAASATRM